MNNPLKLVISSIIFLSFIQCSERIKSYSDYMVANSVMLEKTLNEQNFNNLLLNDLYQNEVFFSSEEHAVSIDKKIEIELLKYLVKNAGVKYLLIEHSYAQSMKYNEYLKSGNENILRNCLDDLTGTLSYTKQFYDYWKEVYKFNQTLAEEDQIWVVGIDLGWPTISQCFKKITY